MNNKTINYYNKYTKSFIQTTRSVDFTNIQNKFLSYLPSGAFILDFGCGSGRDTKYFLKRNYNVSAIDGSEEICKEASKYTGIKVKQMLFEELNDQNIYDGIWACASILHLSKSDLFLVFHKMNKALKENGIIYIDAKEQDGRLTFIVEDSGSGFTKEALLHGTEQFFMDDTSRNGEAHYGMGLFFAKTVAEKYGGGIKLSNSENTGGARVEIFFLSSQETS